MNVIATYFIYMGSYLVVHINKHAITVNSLLSNGKFEHIFRLRTLSVGSEVGWYFIQLVTSSKVNFSSFCNYMNFIYKMSSSSKFMDPKSFSRMVVFLGITPSY